MTPPTSLVTSAPGCARRPAPVRPAGCPPRPRCSPSPLKRYRWCSSTTCRKPGRHTWCGQRWACPGCCPSCWWSRRPPSGAGTERDNRQWCSCSLHLAPRRNESAAYPRSW